MDVVVRTRGRYFVVTAARVAKTTISAADPALGGPATPTSVSTPACDLPARTLDEINSLVAVGVATPTATTEGQTLPAGVPADAEMTANMERVVHLWLACQNAGEPLRGWSLFSDGYLSR